MLRFMAGNVEQGLDTLKDARKFVRSLETQIEETDSAFLQCALQSKVRLHESCSARRKRAR